MGLFERRCMITGVATGFAGSVALVPLLKVGEFFQPAALPIWGIYDGYGSIESVQPGLHPNRFQKAFVDLLTRNVIVVDWPKLLEKPAVPASLEKTCSILERALVHGESAVTCDGRILSFALLNGCVAAALLPDMPVQIPSGADLDDLIRMALGYEEPTVSVFEGLPRENIRTRCKFGSELADFLGLRQWLGRHEIVWVPPYETAQYTSAEALEFLAAARLRFANEPEVLSGLERYESQRDFEE